MTPLRTLHDKVGQQIVTPDAVVSDFLQLCMQLANWHDADNPRNLLLAYRLVALDVEPSRMARSDEEDGTAARALGAQLRQVFAKFEKSPDKFRAAFRRLSPQELDERRKRFDGVHPYARYWFKGYMPNSRKSDAGEVFLSYVVGFATDDALVEFCRALLTDPRFDADRVRRCLREPCKRFFWRVGKRLYCSNECSDKADQKLAVARVRDWRNRQKGKQARKHK